MTSAHGEEPVRASRTKDERLTIIVYLTCFIYLGPMGALFMASVFYLFNVSSIIEKQFVIHTLRLPGLPGFRVGPSMLFRVE